MKKILSQEQKQNRGNMIALIVGTVLISIIIVLYLIS